MKIDANYHQFYQFNFNKFAYSNQSKQYFWSTQIDNSLITTSKRERMQ